MAEFKELLKAIKALSDETRLQMLALLSFKEELCVCDFVSVLGLTQTKASRHLRYMLNMGILEDRKERTWVHYRIAKNLPPEVETLLRAMKTIFQEKQYVYLKKALRNRLEQKRACLTPDKAKSKQKKKSK